MEDKERLSIKIINGKKVIYRPIDLETIKAMGENFRKNPKWVKGSGKKAKSGHKFCPKCSRRFAVLAAAVNDHDGFCSKKCKKGRCSGIRLKEKGLSKEEKRRNRQLRRVEKKKDPEKVDFYFSDAWRELRYKILRKFGFQCMACGMKPPEIILHVDHIKPRFKYPELELDPENLQVLCEACNKGKRHYFEDDLRPRT